MSSISSRLSTSARRQLAQHARRASVLEEQIDDDADLVGGQVLQDRTEVGRVDALEQLLGAEIGPRLQQSAKDPGRDDRLGHGLAPTRGAQRGYPSSLASSTPRPV
jgi:hypothetical protein